MLVMRSALLGVCIVRCVSCSASLCHIMTYVLTHSFSLTSHFALFPSLSILVYLPLLYSGRSHLPIPCLHFTLCAFTAFVVLSLSLLCFLIHTSIPCSSKLDTFAIFLVFPTLPLPIIPPGKLGLYTDCGGVETREVYAHSQREVHMHLSMSSSQVRPRNKFSHHRGLRQHHHPDCDSPSELFLTFLRY